MSVKGFGLVLLFSVSSIHAANTVVYRWVDDDNVVHFTQGQPTNKNFEEVTIAVAYQPSEVAKNNILEEVLAQAEIQKADKAAKELAAQNVQLFKDNCEAAQINLKVLNNYSRIRVTDPSGEQRMLTEEEKTVQEEQTQKHIDIYCVN